jgi:hypothetical protein
VVTRIVRPSDTGAALVVAEDHHPEGGLGSAVLEALTAVKSTLLRLAHLAVRVMPRSAAPTELLAAAAIDAAGIERAARGTPGSEASIAADRVDPQLGARPLDRGMSQDEHVGRRRDDDAGCTRTSSCHWDRPDCAEDGYLIHGQCRRQKAAKSMTHP